MSLIDRGNPIPARLAADIEASEECRLIAYRDTKGLWTCGWGHEMDQSVDHTGEIWTRAQADAQRDADIYDAWDFAAGTPEWPYLDTEARANAVIELCFNMRARWLKFENCRAAIRAGEWQTAHDQLLSSEWETEVHLARATRLANYLLTGSYPT
jgi:GH24 family phage-related lysozyme (muramidase)